ncbi:MAG: hypothetical protein ACI8W7_003748, partial [Gammaproteobacteria bacterium]
RSVREWSKVDIFVEPQCESASGFDPARGKSINPLAR